MTETTTYPILKNATKNAWADAAKYKEMYQQSVSDPGAFDLLPLNPTMRK